MTKLKIYVVVLIDTNDYHIYIDSQTFTLREAAQEYAIRQEGAYHQVEVIETEMDAMVAS